MTTPSPTPLPTGFTECLLHLELVVDRTILAPVAQVRTSADAIACLGPFIAERAQESIAVLAMDAKLHPIAVGLLAVGSVDRAGICMADLFRFALATPAVRLILAHNHPSGDPSPSPGDWQFTEDAAALAAWLGLEVADHLILCPGRAFCSLRLLDPGRFRRRRVRCGRRAGEGLPPHAPTPPQGLHAHRVPENGAADQMPRPAR